MRDIILDMTDQQDDLPVLPGFREMAQRRHAVLDDLVARRRAAGLTQTELAARMGTSQSALARVEAGGTDVRLSTLDRYAAALGHSLEMRVRTEET
jgi:predicted transcriptional regulator